MNLKEQLINSLDNAPEPLIAEVIDFIDFLKAKQKRNTQIPSPNYPLQGSQPYSYDDPFAPAVPLEEWEAMQ